MGYGKHFESMYTGSMLGKGTDVFAVWGYVIATMRVTKLEAHVELNPVLLAFMLGATPAEVVEAIAVLEAPDIESRSKGEDGRRLVLVTERANAGPMQFRVVNGYKYRYTVDEQTKREKDRVRQREYRAKKKAEEWDAEGEDHPLSTQRPMDRGIES